VSTRTTLTLDDDVAARLRSEARRRGVPYRTVVNEAIRAGLAARGRELEPFTVAARPMGLRPGLDLDDIEGLLDLIDGPGRR
jgi:predicted transcriptional regulator